MYGSGIAVHFDDNAKERFQAACSQWHLFDPQGIPPIAWFSLPSATALPSPSIWVPRVLIRVERDRTIITLSAQRDATPPQEVGRQWLVTLRKMLDPPASKRPACNTFLSTTSTPDTETWRVRVRAATAAIASGQLTKLVLARRLSVEMAHPVVPGEIVEHLARDHPECYVLSFPFGRGSVVSATPELLTSKRGRCLVSHALAGTAKRHDDFDVNAAAASALLASVKERYEHAVVVDVIAARMADLCDQVAHPPEPTVLPLRFLQHLWTPVSGRLRSGVSLLDAVTHLHPTPAVLGAPLHAARRWLDKIAECRDGLYTGVVGWVDTSGDGDGVVVLRSAYLDGRTALLCAGAGIVMESDPDAELAETELKLATMLHVLQTT